MTRRRLLLACAAVSGAAGLAAQTLYLRALTTLLGDMFYVHAALVAVFLAALGLGAWAARRMPRSLPWLELAAGLYAPALPALARAWSSGPLYAGAPEAATTAAAVVLLLAPAFCAGAALPLYAAYLKEEARGRAFEGAYAAYNFGGAVCLLIVEFWLLRRLGVQRALWVVGGLHLLCAVLLVGRGLRPRRVAQGARLGAGALAALALTALASAVWQGFYFNACYHLFAPHRQNFALLTAAVLAATGLGALWVRRRRPAFADCALLAAAAVGAVYAAWPGLASLFEILSARLPGASSLLLLKIGWAALLGLPMVFFAAALPALLPGEENLAGDTGRLLAAAGAANALGMLGYVFLVHPRLPVFAAVFVVGAPCFAAAALRGGLRARALTAAAAALLLLRAGTWPEASLYARRVVRGETHTFKHASDSATLAAGAGRVELTYNGHPSITVTLDGEANPAEKLEGRAAAAFAPRRGRALVLGLGSGITAGAAAGLFRQTDVVEINKAFFQMLPRLRRAHGGLGPAVLIHDDARRFLRRTETRYDAVLNTLPSPSYYAAGKLYTREFFALVKDRLAPDGVYLGWFTFGDMSQAGVETLLATLKESFTACSLTVLRESYYLLACSDAPLRLSPIGMPEVEHELAALTLTRNVFAGTHSWSAPLNTDDLPRLEFQILTQGPGRRRLDRVAARPQDFNVDLTGLNKEARGLLAERHPLLRRRLTP